MGARLLPSQVHVDPVNGVCDQPEAAGLRAAPTKKEPLAFAVAFAGGGAKDVTRRYAGSWSEAEKARMCATYGGWWDATLLPLRNIQLLNEAETSRATANPAATAAASSVPAAAAASLPSPAGGGSGGGRGVAEVKDVFIREEDEDKELQSSAKREPIPTSLGAFKNHPSVRRGPAQPTYLLHHLLEELMTSFPGGARVTPASAPSSTRWRSNAQSTR